MDTTIHITHTDQERLANLIELVRREGDRANVTYANRLEKELSRAEIIAAQDISADVVTMRSQVRFRDLDTGEEGVYTLAFPSEANLDKGHISILAPLATSLLGCSRGDTIQVHAPSRTRRLRILQVIYQPERAGHYDL